MSQAWSSFFKHISKQIDNGLTLKDNKSYKLCWKREVEKIIKEKFVSGLLLVPFQEPLINHLYQMVCEDNN